MGVGAYLASITIPEFTAAWSSEAWEGVRGIVLESEVFKPERRGPDKSRKARISYSYAVEGEEYHGSGILFGTTPGLGAQLGLARSAHDLASRYPKGKKVVVYHDPENPKESVLEKRAVRETIQMLSIGGIFLVAGLVAIGRGFRSSELQ